MIELGPKKSGHVLNFAPAAFSDEFSAVTEAIKLNQTTPQDVLLTFNGRQLLIPAKIDDAPIEWSPETRHCARALFEITAYGETRNFEELSPYLQAMRQVSPILEKVRREEVLTETEAHRALALLEILVENKNFSFLTKGMHSNSELESALLKLRTISNLILSEH